MKWINLKEQPPPLGDRALFYASDGSIEVGWYHKNWKNPEIREIRFSGGDWDAGFPEPEFQRRGWDYCVSDDDTPYVYITHWMPLPDKPEVKSEGN